MNLKKIRVEDSIGHVLAHDLTKIVPGRFKGRRFKKGHIIAPGDIPELLAIGKEHLYVLELGAGDVHEDEAAIRIARAACACGAHGLKISEPSEGRVNMVAEHAGILKIELAALKEINQVPDVILATLPNNYPVQAGQVVAGTRVVPLVTREEYVAQAEDICRKRGGILKVLPFRHLKVGVVITGSEVYKGRIKDGFGPVIRTKMDYYQCRVERMEFVPDDAGDICRAILHMVDGGMDLVIACGGMSVDPDDVTPQGIRLTGAKVVTYGAPVLPGAMFMLAYLGEVPVLGLPACAMYHRTTVLDLVLPRILAGERITKEDIVNLAAGGLCLGCSECQYPRCPFGKGNLDGCQIPTC